MQRILLFSILSILVFANCKPDDKHGEITLKVTATYDDQPLVNFDQIYNYPDGTPLKFQLFNYYLSDISLIKANSNGADNHLLSSVELLQYNEFYTPALAQQGIPLEYKDIPEGQYQGIRIGLGLSPDLNATQPGDYQAGHPLSTNYWSASLGYVFAKIEGNADLDGDGTFSDKITYHIGKNNLYQVIELNFPIEIKQGSPANTNINVDLLKILLDDQNNFIDLTEVSNTQDHTNDEDIFGFLWANLSEAFTIEN